MTTGALLERVSATRGTGVLYSTGRPAVLSAITKDRPVDAGFMAIVDSFDIDARHTELV